MTTKNKKTNQNKILPLTIGVIILSLLIVVFIHAGAWTHPTVTPPAGNVIMPGAAAGGWTRDGTVVRLTTITDNVGIGTTAPGARFEVFGTPGTQRITTIPAGTTGTYTLSWDAFQICQFGTCCPPWRDCDGDGRTYKARTDCDEGCATCFVGSTVTTAFADGRDNNCNGQVDEGLLVLPNSGTNQNCNTICAAHGQPCLGIGTDAVAMNNNWHDYFLQLPPDASNWCKSLGFKSGDCTTVMGTCWSEAAGIWQNDSTNCRCGGNIQ